MRCWQTLIEFSRAGFDRGRGLVDVLRQARKIIDGLSRKARIGPLRTWVAQPLEARLRACEPIFRRLLRCF